MGNDFISDFDCFVKTIKESEIEDFREKGIEILNIKLPSEMEVKELKISNRLKNVLIKNGAKTVNDIDQFTNKTTMKMKGLGEKLHWELYTFMFQYQLGAFYRS